jgi:ribosomal protein S24E
MTADNLAASLIKVKNDPTLTRFMIELYEKEQEANAIEREFILEKAREVEVQNGD